MRKQYAGVTWTRTPRSRHSHSFARRSTPAVGARAMGGVARDDVGLLRGDGGARVRGDADDDARGGGSEVFEVSDDQRVMHVEGDAVALMAREGAWDANGGGGDVGAMVGGDVKRVEASDDVRECVARAGAARWRRDVPWTVAYAMCVAFTCAVALVALRSGDLAGYLDATDPTMMNVRAHCDAGDSIAPDFASRNATAAAHALEEVKKLNKAFYGAMYGTVGFMFAIGAFGLRMFQRYGRRMTWGVLITYLMLVASASLGFFIEGSIVSGVACVLLLIFGSTYVITREGREAIESIGTLMTAAGQALAQNPHIFTVTVALALAQMLFASFVLVSTSRLFYNGHLKVNPDKTLRFIGPDAPADESISQCSVVAESAGEEYFAPCCVWETDSWATPFIILAHLFILWTFALCMEIRTYITGGTVARWYFSDTAALGNFKGATADATKNAFGASYGSLCLCSLFSNIVDTMRWVCGAEGQHTWFGTLLSPALVLFEKWTIVFTKYTTIRCAMSGERFLEAGRAVCRLMNNTLFSAFTIWSLPSSLLGTLSFMYSGFWSVLMVAATSSVMRDLDWDAVTSVPGLQMYNEAHTKIVIASYVLLISWGILSFLINVACKSMDACFLCFMMDKENGTVSRVHVYNIFEQMKETERQRKESKMHEQTRARDIELSDSPHHVVESLSE